MPKTGKTNSELSKYLRMISDIRKSRILVIGDIMLDEYVWGATSRISPEAPVPVVEIKNRTFNAGGAANTVSNIISLGAKATPAGIIGKDAAGSRLKKILAGNGIETKYILPVSGRPTTYKVRIVAQGQQVMRADLENTDPVSSAITDKLLKNIRSIFDSIDGIAISDYNKGVICPRLMSGLINMAKESGKTIVADVKPQNIDWFKGVSIIKPNRLEASLMSGIPVRDNRSLLEAGHAIRRRLGIASVLVTLGEEGMALFTEKPGMELIPAVSTQVYDVTGAGDTVLATVAASLSRGHALEDAVRLANYAAGVVVRKRGTATVSGEELVAFIQRKLT